MANLSGWPQAFATDTTVIDVGTPTAGILARARDADGAEYVYLSGTASTVAGKWVTYLANGSTALLTANANGPVAVAMTRNIGASNYAWYFVKGVGTATIADAVTAAASLPSLPKRRSRWTASRAS